MQISFFEYQAVEGGVGGMPFLGRAGALASEEAKKTWIYVIKMMNPPVIE
jgi:hypothetical protein